MIVASLLSCRYFSVLSVYGPKKTERALSRKYRVGYRLSTRFFYEWIDGFFSQLVVGRTGDARPLMGPGALFLPNLTGGAIGWQ
jgi:hypothetical protein